MAKEVTLISLEAKDESIRDVLKKIANVSGYQFLVAEELGNIPVTIRLNNVNLEGSLRRLLRGINYAIVWDEAQKRISISIFGKGVGKWTLIEGSSLSLSGQKTEFDQATSTITRFSGAKPLPTTDSKNEFSGNGSQPTTDSKNKSSGARSQQAPDSDLSLSGEKTKFDQASSTIAK